jgi:hypothetical protein
VLRDGNGTTVRGAGTPPSPFRVDVPPQILVVHDSGTIDLTLDGQPGNYTLTADAVMALGELTNVSGVSPTAGQVLGWDGSQWLPQPPTVAPAGAVLVSGCVQGDGSASSPGPTTGPLRVKLDPAGGLACTSNGLGNAAEYLSNVMIRQYFQFAADDQTLQSNHTSDYMTMPNGPIEFDAPDWAVSVIIDFEVQGMWAANGPWAACLGRLNVHRSTGDSFHPLYGSGLGGISMVSVRNGGSRGSTIGYREVRRISDVVGGETFRLYSQMRASAAVTGGGDVHSDASNAQLQAKVTWSDAL